VRWVGHTLAAVLAVLTLAVAAAIGVLWLLATESGTSWVMTRLLARTSPALTVGRVSGAMLGTIVFEDVRLRLTRDQLDIGRLEAQWNPAAALLGELAFGTARSSLVSYRRLPSTGAPPGGLIPALPFTLRIDDAVAEGVRVAIGDDVLELAETRASATYAGRHLSIQRSASTSGTTTLGGTGDIRFEDPIGFAVEIEWSGPALGTEAAGRVRLDGDWPVLAVHHDLTAPFTATAQGELRFESTLRFDLGLQWQNLFIPGVPLVVSPIGSATIQGSFVDYRFEGTGTLTIDERASSFTAAGSGDAGEITIERLAVEGFIDGQSAGTLRATGNLSFGNPGATLALEAQNFDPRWVHEWFPGRLSGTASLRSVFKPSFEARFTDANLRGELRGYPVAIGGAARVEQGNLWTLDALRLDSGPNQVTLDGKLDTEKLSVKVAADVDELDLLLPGVDGGLTGTVDFGGTWREPSGSGRFEASGLAIGDYRVERLAVDGRAGLAPGTRLDLTIDAADIARGAFDADTVRVTFAGTTSALRATLDAQAEDWHAAAAASGAIASLTWRGSIDSLNVDEKVFGDWRLAEPARASAGRAGFTLDTSCLLHESGGRWCAELELDGGTDDRLVFSAQNFNLSALRPLLPPQLSLDGVYQLSASFSDLQGDVHGAAVLTGGTTQARVVFGTQQAYSTDFQDFLATATLEKGQLELKAGVSSSSGGRAQIDARIDDVRARNSKIGGNVAVQWPDLVFLALLAPDVGDVGGALSVDLSVGGTMNAPTVDGRGLWTQGRVTLPQWGLVVDGIEASATSQDGRTLALEARGQAGDGELRVTGTTSLDPRRGWPTRLELTGTELLAVQLPEAQIWVTPDLDIDVALPDVRVTGTVRVPRATIELTGLPAQAVAPSPDTVVHSETLVIEVTTPIRLSSDIQLELGDEVRYTGLNLATRVAGGMRLDAPANRTATASGTLTLTGTYNAYGQVLELERGQLLFNGPLDNPGLDVRAARTIETTIGSAEPIRVGVELTGTVQSPRTRVISTPAMTEADALSYLLLGRPVTGTGDEETTALQTAAISMGLQQALPAVQKIGQTLGLDELSVQTTDTDAGALMAGKYLSPKVYIRYSYGLFNRIGGLLLRFKVNDRLSLETRSGDQESMDLLYTIEKD
jgi:translocation and assembly module TamB